MSEITTKIVADSISPSGVRLTTMELCYHRFIHAEFMTHRMFSRNASSSRAIPVDKVIEQVINSPAIPVSWGINRPGMQAIEELVEEEEAEESWKVGVARAVYTAKQLQKHKLHKQIVNRVLEPYQMIRVIVTATEWENFFKLRLHKDAQPEIQELARCMKEVMDEATPDLLQPVQWHLPYIKTGEFVMSMFSSKKELYNTAIKCSVARCARVSYNNHDNSSPDIGKDIALADMLLEAGHMSPFEHQGTPMDFAKDTFELAWENGITHKDRDNNFWSGNFRGWIQYRQLIGG